MYSRALLLAALALTACSTSDSGEGGGDGSTSTASGSATDDSLVFATWAWLQGRFSTEPDGGTGGEAPAPKVMVGCPVDLPEIGSRAVYVEHADEGMPPDAQFVIVTEETPHELPDYVHSGVARIHRVADPAVWAGQCNGDALAAPGAVEAEPACEVHAGYVVDAPGPRVMLQLPATCIADGSPDLSLEVWEAVVKWRPQRESGPLVDGHELWRRTPAPAWPAED